MGSRVGPAAVVLCALLGGCALVGMSPVAAATHPQRRASVVPPGATLAHGSFLAARLPASGRPPISGLDPDPDLRRSRHGGGSAHVDADDYWSSNWSGEVDEGTTFSATRVEWTVPAVSASETPKYEASWTGIGGVETTRLIQAGTISAADDGATEYWAWYEVLPEASIAIDDPVSPGDTMIVLIDEKSAGHWYVGIEDVTQEWIVTGIVAYTAGTATSAEWITERPEVGTHLAALATYGSNEFYDLGVDGTDLTDTFITTLVMINTTGQIVSYPGPLLTGGTKTNHFTIYNETPLPTVGAVKPATGPSTGGTSVTITGTFIVEDLVEAVDFGEQPAKFTDTANGTVVATAPPGVPGTVDITITTTDGTSIVSSADRFTYSAVAPVVTSLTPDTGAPAGGSTVTVHGKGFMGVTAVAFGTSAATTFSVKGPTLLSATVPPGTGTVDVTVSNSAGRSPAAASSTFHYGGGGSSYDLVGADGGVFVFSTGHSQSGFYGSLPGLGVKPSAPIVGMVATTDDTGYFLVGADGGVFAFGDAAYLGSLPGDDVVPRVPITGIVAADTDRGYFLVGRDGGVFAFGTVPFLGSLPSQGVQVDDITGIAATPSGNGYWLVAATGAVYAFGTARHLGTDIGTPSAVTAIAGTPTGGGYWVITQDGAVYPHGNAAVRGTLPSMHVTPQSPIIGIVRTEATTGYWLIGADGGIFAFTAPYAGSLPGDGVSVSDIVGAVATST